MGGITSPPISCPERRRWSLNSPSRRQGDEGCSSPPEMSKKKKQNWEEASPLLRPVWTSLGAVGGTARPGSRFNVCNQQTPRELLGCEQEGRRCLPPWMAASGRAAAAFCSSFPRRAHGEAARLHGNELEGSTEEKHGKNSSAISICSKKPPTHPTIFHR